MYKVPDPRPQYRPAAIGAVVDRILRDVDVLPVQDVEAIMELIEECLGMEICPLLELIDVSGSAIVIGIHRSVEMAAKLRIGVLREALKKSGYRQIVQLRVGVFGTRGAQLDLNG